ncbi:MAG: hypothetical protein AB1403_04205 [Candidatus Riflebacteria bacterium]
MKIFQSSVLNGILITSILRTALKKIIKPLKIDMHFCVLGPRRAGKTTLLTAIYDSMNKMPIFDGKKYLLSVEQQTKLRLDEKLSQLKNLANQISLFMKPDFPATSDCTKYCFSLGYSNLFDSKEKNLFLDTFFYDFPGGWLSPNTDDCSQEEVDEIVAKSQVIIVPIDIPSLMEEEGIFFAKFNIRPDNLVDFFKRNFRKLKEPRLVILVPLRCEKYFYDAELRTEMVNKVREKYQKTERFFASEGQKDFINYAILPVCTLGNYVFHSINNAKETVEFRYKKRSGKELYSPKNCDHLWLRIIFFMLRIFEDRDRYPQGLNVLKKVDELGNILKTLKNDVVSIIPANSVIKILQGNYISTEMD